MLAITCALFIHTVPGPPRSVQVVEDAVALWQEPDKPNGNITGYDVGIGSTPEQITVIRSIDGSERNFYVITRSDVSASPSYVRVRANELCMQQDSNTICS